MSYEALQMRNAKDEETINFAVQKFWFSIHLLISHKRNFQKSSKNK
jgi:hypothetical protein